MIPSVLLMFVQVKRTIIRYETATLLEQTQLQQITLKESDLNWEEPGRELWVNGKLFDIKLKLTSSNGYVSFKGLFDEKETELNQQVDAMLNSKHSTLLLLAKIISLQSPTIIDCQVIDSWLIGDVDICFFDFQQIINTRSIEKNIPPPKLFV
jgi:hypothetical protein